MASTLHCNLLEIVCSRFTVRLQSLHGICDDSSYYWVSGHEPRLCCQVSPSNPWNMMWTDLQLPQPGTLRGSSIPGKCLHRPSCVTFPPMQQDMTLTDSQPCSAPTVNDPLPFGYYYTGPLVSTATPCKCSTVYYSLISACATCQDREYLTSVPFFSS